MTVCDQPATFEECRSVPIGPILLESSARVPAERRGGGYGGVEEAMAQPQDHWPGGDRGHLRRRHLRPRTTSRRCRRSAHTTRPATRHDRWRSPDARSQRLADARSTASLRPGIAAVISCWYRCAVSRRAAASLPLSHSSLSVMVHRGRRTATTSATGVFDSPALPPACPRPGDRHCGAAACSDASRAPTSAENVVGGLLIGCRDPKRAHLLTHAPSKQILQYLGSGSAIRPSYRSLEEVRSGRAAR